MKARAGLPEGCRDVKMQKWMVLWVLVRSGPRRNGSDSGKSGVVNLVGLGSQLEPARQKQ